MNILVTGGSGTVGRGVVTRLVNSGHVVRVLDTRADKDPIAGAAYVIGDITRFDDVREQVRGMNGIVDLAAYTFPAAAAGQDIFRVNCTGAYNIFEAAASEGIQRVTCASSINALGYNFGVKSFPIRYFPIDEDHPTGASDPYSFSKQTLESTAAYYWRRDGIVSTCLRLPSVFAAEMTLSFVRPILEARQQVLKELLTAPLERQHEWIAKIADRLADQRARRMTERPWRERMPGPPDEVFIAGFGHTDFWAIIDVEDAAQAFEKSLLADFEGSHALFVCQRENATGVESERLLDLFYPEVGERKRPITGAASIVSYDHAAKLIGYEPQVLVRDRLA